MRASPDKPLHCLIVGGGPAGLTAAIYLARFHLDVEVVDAGNSRAASIPLTRNHAGFPEGISGPDLLNRMGEQARLYGALISKGRVVSLLKQDDGLFSITTEDGACRLANTVLLATGVVNIAPDLPRQDHDAAVQRGLIRYCPICDGFEVIDRRVAVYGSGDRGAKEALFLRGYTKDVTLLLPIDQPVPGPALQERLDRAGIARITCAADAISIAPDAIVVQARDDVLRFETMYPALGSYVRSELAAELGADCSAEGCLKVDAHQRTSVGGLFAAGDVVLGLDQISHAMGEGGVAATTIRNDLDERSPLWR